MSTEARSVPEISREDQDLARYEDARRLANFAMWAVELQVLRLRSGERQIADFKQQPLFDFHALLTALCRLRGAARLATTICRIDDAIVDFDSRMPWLRKMRNTLEHYDEYREGKGQNRTVNLSQLEVFHFETDSITWLDEKVELAVTVDASAQLFSAIQNNPPAGWRGDA